MDLNSFKEILKNIYNIITNNPVFYFIKEKYDHLSSFYRKIIQVFSLLILICIVFYYPVSRFYSSWKNIRNFDTKTQLIRELINLSAAKQINTSGTYTPNIDPLRFIEQRIPTLLIPKNQVTKIKNIQNRQEMKGLPASTTVKTVKLEMKDLNLKEVIQYGHQLEQLSGNIKLINLFMKESQEKENYFNVSYILKFFSSTHSAIPDRQKKQNKIFKTKEEKNFDNLKPQSTKVPSIDIKPVPIEETQKKKKSPSLLDLKKSDFTGDNTHFENRPTKVKKRDLLPTPPTPEIKKDNPPLSNSIPPSPHIVPPPPELESSPKEKQQKDKK